MSGDAISLTVPDLSMLQSADGTPFSPGATIPIESPDEIKCPDCGRTDFKNPSGLKRHRTTAHGTKDTEGVSIPRRIQKDVAGKGAPSADQLTAASGRLLGYGSIAIASIVVDEDPRRPLWTPDQADEVIDALSATPDEAKDIMRPLARIFAGTTLNKRVGRKIVDNMDAADSVVALIMMSRRWSKYLGERNAYARAMAAQGPSAVPQMNGTQPAPSVMQERIAEQDSRQGVIVTPDMLRNN